MKAGAGTRVFFVPEKYGQPLAVDASSFPQWTGIVPDGEPHSLDFHEFLVVSRGQADVELGGRVARIAGPAVLFTPPRMIRRVEVIDPLQLQLVVFSERAFLRSSWGPALRGIAAGLLPVTDSSAVAPLNAIAALMSAEVSAPRPDSSLMLDALLAQFLVTLNRARGAPAADAPALARRFERLLERRFRDDHDVAAYADALGVSSDHLSAVIRSHYGVSAKAMIARRLFNEAVSLLGSPAHSVADVAARLGFEEPGHFTRFFTRASGESPSRFRRAI